MSIIDRVRKLFSFRIKKSQADLEKELNDSVAAWYDAHSNLLHARSRYEFAAPAASEAYSVVNRLRVAKGTKLLFDSVDIENALVMYESCEKKLSEAVRLLEQAKSSVSAATKRLVAIARESAKVGRCANDFSVASTKYLVRVTGGETVSVSWRTH